MSKKFKRLLLLYAVIVLVLTTVVVFHESRKPRAVAELWFLDIGQGDAALLREEGKTILIDGGPDDAVLEGLATALPPWQKKIDVMIVTHLDADHYMGFFAVLRRYEVGEVWWSGVAPTTETARRFVETVKARGIPEHFATAGDRLEFPGGRALTASWPEGDPRGLVVPKIASNKNGGGTNDFGIVTRYDCGDDEALMTADVSSVVEAKLVASGREIESEVLKVGHHGSAYSSSEAFLDAVRPREAVISVGANNRYGHPTPRVLSALLERGIAVHRTDRDGSIRFVCEGGRLKRASARRWWKL